MDGPQRTMGDIRFIYRSYSQLVMASVPMSYPPPRVIRRIRPRNIQKIPDPRLKKYPRTVRLHIGADPGFAGVLETPDGAFCRYRRPPRCRDIPERPWGHGTCCQEGPGLLMPIDWSVRENKGKVARLTMRRGFLLSVSRCLS